MEQEGERRKGEGDAGGDGPKGAGDAPAGTGRSGEYPSSGERSPWKLHDSGIGGGALAGAGIQFAVSILLFLYVGQWLDNRFGWSPWGTLLGVFVGAAAGFTSIYRRLMGELRREEESRRRR